MPASTHCKSARSPRPGADGRRGGGPLSSKKSKSSIGVPPDIELHDVCTESTEQRDWELGCRVRRLESDRAMRDVWLVWRPSIGGDFARCSVGPSISLKEVSSATHPKPDRPVELKPDSNELAELRDTVRDRVRDADRVDSPAPTAPSPTGLHGPAPNKSACGLAKLRREPRDALLEQEGALRSPSASSWNRVVFTGEAAGLKTMAPRSIAPDHDTSLTPAGPRSIVGDRVGIGGAGPLPSASASTVLSVGLDGERANALVGCLRPNSAPAAPAAKLLCMSRERFV